MLRTALILALLSPSGVSFAADDAPAGADPDAAKVEFFEKKIRPVLVDNCYKCHSADAKKDNKLKGGLLLDSKAGWEKGGDTGAAIVPGKPGEGPRRKSLQHGGEVKRPRKGKLRDGVTKASEKGTAEGAIPPRGDASTKPAAIETEKGKQFWSFGPPKKPPVPVSRET